jgi:adenine-specific DNA-methyltransferase
MSDIEKLPLTSLDIKTHQLERLKEIFPEAFTEGNKVDWDKLRLTLGEAIDTGKERYGMNWPGKSECFKTIQQPSIATLVPAREESVDFDTTQNLFIEGDNLEVLKLLQKSYLGKVKMIYIDPPYNTGNDFIYPDNYAESLDTYLAYTGQVDDAGKKFSTNTETDGRFHSKWMNMMYPRLFLAKNLLKEDGLIFISIDDHEVHNLRALCNEIFGEENFISEFVWQKRITRENRSVISVMHEYVLLYGKSIDSVDENLIGLLPMDEQALDRYRNPDNDARGNWTSVPAIAQAGHGTKSQFYTLITPSGREIDPPSGSCWRYTKEKMDKEIKLNNIWFGTDGTGVPRIKKFLDQGRQGLTPTTLLNGKEIGTTDQSKRELVELFDGKSVFETPKPVGLISHIIRIGSGKDDIVLDFFCGSAPTAHAVFALNKEDAGNRHFICVQIPEPTDETSEAFKVGYKTIADIGKERIRRVITKTKKEQKENKTLFSEGQVPQDLGFKVFKLQKSNFNIWNAGVAKTSEAIQQQLFSHVDHISPEAGQEAILYELLLKSGFELTIAIEPLTLEGKTVYSIAEGELLICLEKQLTHEVIQAMAERRPTRVICLDEGFQDNDQLKTNAVQIMKSKGVVNFRTV